MGIALRQSEPAFQIVEEYYKRAKREITRRGDLEIARTDAFTPNFFDLVQMLASKQQSHVVIVAHGAADGLLMSLTDKTADRADNAVLKDLVTLVDEHPKDTGKIALFATGYTVPEDQVRSLVEVCHKVRSHDSNCVAVHIRGCKIGVDVGNLETIRRLFNSIVVSAPKCPMLYAPFNPEWSRPADKDIAAWKTRNRPDTRRRDFTDAAGKIGPFVLDVNYAGSSASTQGVIRHADDLPRWADLVYGHRDHGVTRDMPIAAMWPDSGYFLPHEKGYLDQINAARVT